MPVPILASNDMPISPSKRPPLYIDRKKMTSEPAPILWRRKDGIRHASLRGVIDSAPYFKTIAEKNNLVEFLRTIWFVTPESSALFGNSLASLGR